MELTGKTLLITGATNGIGLEAAVELARRGAKVVMVGRDSARTDAAVAQVRQRSGSHNVEALLCDFSSFADTRKLAEQYRARYDRLDVLVNNAGGVFKDRTVTKDGLEATFEVNHLAPFLLTSLLIDLLEKSAPARIVNVSSIGHYQGTMDFADLGFEKGYSIMNAYRRSKLGNVLFTRLLAKKLAGKNVTVNALHPGGVATNIWSGAPAWSKPLLAVAKLFMVSPEEGGRRIVYLAAGDEVAGKTGLYFENDRVREPSKLAQDDALAIRLWAESEKLTATHFAA